MRAEKNNHTKYCLSKIIMSGKNNLIYLGPLNSELNLLKTCIDFPK